MHDVEFKIKKSQIVNTISAEMLLENLGFSIHTSNGIEIRCPCKIHGGDNPTAFRMRLDTKKWKCFTHKCEQTSSGRISNDIFSLVMMVNQTSFTEAYHFLSGLCGLTDYTVNPQVFVENDISTFIKKSKKVVKKDKNLLDEDIIRSYINNRSPYFLEQGISKEILDMFEVGTVEDSLGTKWSTIPIRDHNSLLVGMSSRREGIGEPRYRILKNFEKTSVLYNYFRVIENKSDFIILTEGFKACWAVSRAGYINNVVACMGSSITERQALLLTNLNVKCCYLMLDGDTAGQKGMSISNSILQKYTKVVPIYLSDNKSPDDFSEVDLKSLFSYFLKE